VLQILAALVWVAFPRLVVVARIIPQPMGRQSPATTTVERVTRRAVMGAKVDNQTVAWLERGVNNLVITWVTVPVGRNRIILP